MPIPPLITFPILLGCFFSPSAFGETINLWIKNWNWKSETIEIALADETYLFNREHSSKSSRDSSTWIGVPENTSIGRISLARLGTYQSGIIVYRSKAYRFSGIGPSFDLTPVRQALPCGGCIIGNEKFPVNRRALPPVRSWRNGDANLIDLLVVYPVDVINAAGGYESLKTAVSGAVADTNLCYINSQLDVRVRLVGFEQIEYEPSGTLETDLDRLQDLNDGFMDEVGEFREQFGADVVSLLATHGNKGGLANTMNTPSLGFADSAFNVNLWDQIGAPSYTLAHEIGHNMGCLHNREDVSVEDARSSEEYDFYEFGYGKRWTTNEEGYRTVMAYDDVLMNYSSGIPYFSNPEVFYLGVSTGNVGTENNAQVISMTAPYVSNFRASKIQAIYPNQFSKFVNEGNATSIGVRLATKPIDEVVVSVSLSEDSSFRLIGEPRIVFTKSNWNLAQPIGIFAESDLDLNNDSASLILESDGIASTTVELIEIDSRNSNTSDVIVSGFIRNQLGMGVEGVEIQLAGMENTLVTGDDGLFHTLVPAGWSGTLSFTKDSFSLDPSQLTFDQLYVDQEQIEVSGTRSRIAYVDQNALGRNDGSSWANAFTDLANALNAPLSIDEIWVASGTYFPGTVRSSTFALPPAILVYGGFAGDEENKESRSPLNNETILSGDLGVLGSMEDNAYHVVTVAEGSHLDGFVVRDGYANKNITNDFRGKGGGLLADGAGFTVANCRFLSNQSFQGGSAVFLNDANGTFIDCVFSDNQTDSSGSGGAVFIEDSYAQFQSCLFDKNYAHFYGGAIHSTSSSLSLDQSSFTENQSLTSNGGGALYAENGSISITSSSFSSNRSIFDGGAILAFDLSAVIEDSNFTANVNSASNGGGAIHFSSVTGSITRSRFIENVTYATNYGGAIKLSSSSPVISQCNFVGNLNLNNSGGAIGCSGNASPVIFDNNFSYNQAGQGGALFVDGGESSISENYFIENSANVGGALYLKSFGSDEISENEFLRNSSTDMGGAIFLDSSSLIIDSGNFIDNFSSHGGAVSVQNSDSISFQGIKGIGNEANASASGNGGFLYQGLNSMSAKFVNCILSGNRANQYGGVVRPSHQLSFTNCTIVGNESLDAGGVVILFEGDSLNLENSILWNNHSQWGNEIAVNSGSASAHYSLFDPAESQGVINGTENISGDPLFVDQDGLDGVLGTSDDDFQLQASSPAINIGSNGFTDYPSHDILGKSRSGKPDLGAYEFWVNSPPEIISGSTVSLSENQTDVIKVLALDNEGESLTFSILDGLDGSLFSIDEFTGSLSFVSPPDFEQALDLDENGEYQLTIGISDGTSISEQLLRVSPYDVDEAPTIDQINNTLKISFPEDSRVTYDFNGTDPDSGSELVWSIGSIPQNGSAEINADTGAFAYEPVANFHGTDQVIIQLSDRTHVVSLSVELEVAPVSDSPILTIDESYSVVEGTTQVVELSGNDPDGDEIAFLISGGDDLDLFRIDSNSSILCFVQAPVFSEPKDKDKDNQYELLISVSDGPLSDTQKILVSVTENTLPDSLSIALADDQNTFALFEDSEWIYDLNISNPDSENVLWSIHTPPFHGSVSIDSETGLLRYSPQVNFAGSDSTIVQVSDGSLSDQVTLNFFVSPVNDPPVFTSPTSLQIMESQSLVGELNASDPEGDELTFSISTTGDSQWFMLNQNTNSLFFMHQPDFSSPLDLDGDNLYEVSGEVSDGQLKTPFNLRIQVLDPDANESIVSNSIQAEAENLNGWSESSWFGDFFGAHYPWIYHSHLGWVYAGMDENNSLWLFKESLGWLWSDYSTYSYFFVDDDDNPGWIFIELKSQPVRYYDFRLKDWYFLD